MNIERTPLLLEGHNARVKRRMKRWERAHRKLEAITKAGYRKVAKRTANWETRIAGETPEEHARRIGSPSDVDADIHDSVAGGTKFRRRLDKAKAREAKRRAELESAERERDAHLERKRRREQMMNAPVPSLGPVDPTKTPAAISRVRKMATVRKIR